MRTFAYWSFQCVRPLINLKPSFSNGFGSLKYPASFSICFNSALRHSSSPVGLFAASTPERTSARRSRPDCLAISSASARVASTSSRVSLGNASTIAVGAAITFPCATYRAQTPADLSAENASRPIEARVLCFLSNQSRETERVPQFVAEGEYFELCVKKYTRMLTQEMGGGE